MNLLRKITAFAELVRYYKSSNTITMTFYSQEYNEREQRCMAHMGEKLQFSKAKPVDELCDINAEIYSEVKQYISSVLMLFVDGEDLMRLADLYVDFAYGRIYWTGTDKPFNVGTMTSMDMMHFCWNIWNRTKPLSRKVVARFLKRTFPSLFEDLSEKSIYSKMTNDDCSFSVPIIKKGSLLGK